MWSKFARNGILVGQVEAYCLVCRCHLITEEHAYEHLLQSKHITDLHAIGYYDKYPNDYIRKVKGGYFCGMCNTLLATATHVKLHVVETRHIDNRGASLLSRVDSSTGSANSACGILVSGNVLLPDDAWHGLVDETCVICNAEFDDKDTHKKDPTHLLKLVQSKVLFGDKKSVIRKIDEGLFQCLTCNIVVSATSFNDHFDSTDHQVAYEQCEITDDDSMINNVSDSTITFNYHKHNIDIKTSIDYTQIGVIEESHNTFEVKALELNDVICEPVSLPLDTGHKETKQSKNTDRPAQNNIDIEKDFKTQTDAEQPIQTTKETEEIIKKSKEAIKTKKETNEAMKDKEKTNEAIKTKENTNEAIKTKEEADEAIKTKDKYNEAIQTKKEADEAVKPSKDNEQPTESSLDTEEKPNTNMESNLMKSETQEFVSNILNRSLILDSVPTFQNNDVNIDLINDTAYCKKCTMNIDFEYNSINKHIDDHKKKANKKADKKVKLDHGAKANGGNTNLFTKPVFKTQNGDSTSAASVEDIRAMAKKHGMMYNGRELHCTTCDSTLPVGIKSIEEHVNGNRHKAKMPQPVLKIEPKKNVTKELIENFIKDTKIFDEDNCKEFVINERFCLPFLSLLFIGGNGNHLKCIACDVKLSSAMIVDGHVNSLRHQKILEECYVVTSLDTEFVREMIPNVYHCGFCNAAVGDWKGLEKHLNSSGHKKSKARSDRRLRKHMNDVRANKTKPGVYNCSFCNYVANDWDTLNAHFSTREHVMTKMREERRAQMLMGCVNDPRMREQMDHDMFNMFKGRRAPNFCESDSD